MEACFSQKNTNKMLLSSTYFWLINYHAFITLVKLMYESALQGTPRDFGNASAQFMIAKETDGYLQVLINSL